MRLSLLSVALLTPGLALAQEPTSAAIPRTPEPRAEDVSSMDAILKAVYDVISGPAGQKRDWDRMRSLFLPEARMIVVGQTRTGEVRRRVITPEGYIAESGPFLEKDGFFEREIARKVEQFGNISHVFSTYEGRHKVDDKDPFLRGINSIQLLDDGKRWWIVTIMWQAENPSLKLPAAYLPSGG